MSSSLIILLEFGGVVGVVLGLGCWELWRLRRDQARDRGPPQSDDEAPRC